MVDSIQSTSLSVSGSTDLTKTSTESFVTSDPSIDSAIQTAGAEMTQEPLVLGDAVMTEDFLPGGETVLPLPLKGGLLPPSDGSLPPLNSALPLADGTLPPPPKDGVFARSMRSMFGEGSMMNRMRGDDMNPMKQMQGKGAGRMDASAQQKFDQQVQSNNLVNDLVSQGTETSTQASVDNVEEATDQIRLDQAEQASRFQVNPNFKV